MDANSFAELIMQSLRGTSAQGPDPRLAQQAALIEADRIHGGNAPGPQGPQMTAAPGLGAPPPGAGLPPMPAPDMPMPVKRSTPGRSTMGLPLPQDAMPMPPADTAGMMPDGRPAFTAHLPPAASTGGPARFDPNAAPPVSLGSITDVAEMGGSDDRGTYDTLWERDRTVAPSGQPKLADASTGGPARFDANDGGLPSAAPAVATPGAKPGQYSGLPYSTPAERPQAPVTQAVETGLPSVPTPSTRMTGSTGKPSAEATVDTANKLNIVQRLARDWFGVDTPEERKRAKTYMAHWAAAMATSKAGLGAFAEANLAGIEGVDEEELRQLKLDMNAEDRAIAAEERAYERTRDAQTDARAAQRDARQAQMDQFTIDKYQEEAALRRAESANPLTMLDDIDDPNLYMDTAYKLALAQTGDPEAATKIAQAMYDRWMASKQRGSAGLDLGALIGAQPPA